MISFAILSKTFFLKLEGLSDASVVSIINKPDPEPLNTNILYL